MTAENEIGLRHLLKKQRAIVNSSLHKDIPMTSGRLDGCSAVGGADAVTTNSDFRDVPYDELDEFCAVPESHLKRKADQLAEEERQRIEQETVYRE